MLKSKHPALPALAALGFFALWSVFWLVMQGRIEGEIETWVERQAEHGTEVSYRSLDISGYPFRLVASFEEPRIISRDDPSAFRWDGMRLRIITQAWNIRHIIVELLGEQSVAWLDAPHDASRTPSQIQVSFTGEQLRGSLKLSGGRIKSIDTEFLKVAADFTGDGGFALLPDLPEHLDINLLEYHSRISKGFNRGQKITKRDAVLFAEGLSGGTPPANTMKNGAMKDDIEEILVAFSEELTGMSPLHSGDIGANLTPVPAQQVEIHEAHIFWKPVSIRLNGKLERPETRDFDGQITLYLKGHEELVRTMAEDGDLPDAAALVAGGLFGVLSMVSETNADGELVMPLDVKDGAVYFGFLPLFDTDDLR